MRARTTRTTPNEAPAPPRARRRAPDDRVPPTDMETARRLEQMGYPFIVALRAASRGKELLATER